MAPTSVFFLGPSRLFLVDLQTFCDVDIKNLPTSQVRVESNVLKKHVLWALAG